MSTRLSTTSLCVAASYPYGTANQLRSRQLRPSRVKICVAWRPRCSPVFTVRRMRSVPRIRKPSGCTSRRSDRSCACCGRSRVMPQRLDEEVRRHRERRDRAQREGGRSIGQDLALVGVVGWTLVIPALLGVYAGRALDRRFGSGVFWTLGLLVAGIVLGCVLAWQRL